MLPWRCRSIGASTVRVGDGTRRTWLETGWWKGPIPQTPEGHYWGHSDSLNLDLCWEEGNLRFWDPVARIYLNTFADERAARSAAEARVMDAEARVHEL